MEIASKQAVIEVARRELSQRGRRVEDFDMSVTRRGNGWEVGFTGREPSPPGADISVFLDEQGQVTRVMLDE
jgi:hypothetical protein